VQRRLVRHGARPDRITDGRVLQRAQPGR
jgi:hypothetical protein